MHILDVMNEAIDAPDEMSPYAPRVISVKVPVDKIVVPPSFTSVIRVAPVGAVTTPAEIPVSAIANGMCQLNFAVPVVSAVVSSPTEMQKT